MLYMSFLYFYIRYCNIFSHNLYKTFLSHLLHVHTINLDRCYVRRGVQYFPRGTIEDIVNPKDIWHGGAKYPRISCMGVLKSGGVRITVTPV